MEQQPIHKICKLQLQTRLNLLFQASNEIYNMINSTLYINKHGKKRSVEFERKTIYSIS